MTDEMKENIIKYLTGNMVEETPDHDLIYSEVKSISNNLSSQLNNLFGEARWAIRDIIQGKTSSGNESELSLMYGTYSVGETTDITSKGFMVIVDNMFNVIQIITKYSSNVDIGIIYCLNVDENGQFYMVEKRLSDNKIRFIMLNNILVKLTTSEEYSVVIRRAYDIPSSSPAYDTSNRTTKIIKAVGQPKYLIAGTTGVNIGYGVFTTELIINVGSSNEWNTLIGSSAGEYVDNIDIYCVWGDDTYDPIIIAYLFNYNGVVLKYKKNSLGTILNFQQIHIDFTGYNILWGQNAVILNDQVGYFALAGNDANLTTFDRAMFKLDLTNNTSSLLLKSTGDYDIEYTGMTPIKLFNKDNEVIFWDIDQQENISKMIFTFSVGRIRSDDTYYTSPISMYEVATKQKNYQEYFDIINLNINKQFNLYNFNFLIDDTCYNTYQVYNSLNYNGESFIDTKSLLPNQGVLYDSNDDIIFARNLYNKVLSGGTTTSSIEIPNNLLNDITISTKDLWSFNNNILINDTEDFVKNQYETVDINFINTIGIINENNINNPISNPIGATRLNNSISNILDYNNNIISKIRLNYSDNTTFIKAINPASRISQFVYQYVFNVYVPSNKSVNSIDMLSYDENTIYQTIDTTSLLRSKAYKISQNVEIQ